MRVYAFVIMGESLMSSTGNTFIVFREFHDKLLSYQVLNQTQLQ